MNTNLKFGLGFLITVGSVIFVVLMISCTVYGTSNAGDPGRGESDSIDEPVDITIDPETYIDMFDEVFLKSGGTYNLSATAPSQNDDANMSRVVFQQSIANYPGAIWDDIGTDNNTSDTSYSVQWIPDTEHFYVRAISYDTNENYAISDVFTNFHVDGLGPVAPLTLQATAKDMHSPKAQVNGYIYDRIVEGQTSGVDYVVLYVNGDLIMSGNEPVKIPVIDYYFDYSFSLDTISGSSGDVSYSITARGYDHVGNAGNLSDPAVWTNTDHPDAIRIISPQSIKDIPMEEELDDPDDNLDEIRSVTVTFLNTEQDYVKYVFTIRPGQLTNNSQAADLGLPDGTKFLRGYYTIEVPEDFTNFEAQVTFEFHISDRSQLGTRTSEILENIRLVSKPSGESDFEVLYLIGDQVQPIDADKGMYRVQARINRFSDFAIVIAQTDLTIKEIKTGAFPAIAGQTIGITVTVHNGGDFPKDAETVKVKVFAIDEDGNQEYIGELEYGTIDPNRDYYLADPSLKKGDVQRTLFWETPTASDSQWSVDTYTIKGQVDPDGYTREISEINNEMHLMMEIVGVTSHPPIPRIIQPKGGSMVNGNVTIKGMIPEDDTTVGIVYQPFGNNDFAWHVEKVTPDAVSVHSVNYILVDDGGNEVAGGTGPVSEIYGLNFDDHSTYLSFQDNDRDGKLSAGDVFLVKNMINGGLAVMGHSLELEFGNVEKVEILINEGHWITVNGTDLWNHEWDSTTVGTDKCKIYARSFDGNSYSDEYSITITIGKDDGNETSETSILVMLVVLLGSLMFILISIGIATFGNKGRN